MKRVLVGLFFFILCTNLSYASEWSEVCSKKVYTNTDFQCSAYNITDIQFNAPATSHIYNGTLILDTILSPSMILKIDGELIGLTPNSEWITENMETKARATNFSKGTDFVWDYESYFPNATLTIYARTKPNLSINITVDKNNYTLYRDRTIYFSINISNQNPDPMNNILLKNTFGGLVIRDAASSTSFETLNAKEIKYINGSLNMPSVEGTYTISTDVTVESHIGDKVRILYYHTDSGPIIIHPSSASPHYITPTKYIKSRLYTEKPTSVMVSVSNSGDFTIRNLTIVDYYKSTGIPHILTHGALAPTETAILRYTVTPTQQGVFTSPPAQITYEVNGETHSIKSNDMLINVISTGALTINQSNDEMFLIVPSPPPTTILPQSTTTASMPTPQHISPEKEPEIKTNGVLWKWFFIGIIIFVALFFFFV